MKTNRLWLLAAAVGLAAWSVGAAYGQGAPGNAAGPKGNDAVKAADGGEAKPAADPGPARPNLPDIVSPDAAKQLDEDDLLNKLTHKEDAGQTGGDPMQKMTRIMDRMGQVETRLSAEKDPGLMTQEAESRIVMELDAMIELLKKQQQKSQSQSQSKSQPGQEKQESQGQSQGPPQQGGNQAATSDPLPGGSPKAAESNGRDMHEDKLGWGDLPPRDRDLVANGAKEKYLPEYSDMIQRYYEALAELGKSTKER